MEPSEEQQITRLLQQWSQGDDDAFQRLVPLVYDQLRRLASVKMKRERKDHTLQRTALIHELYIDIMGARDVSWKGREHFYSIATRQMRRILIDHARRRNTLRRGKGSKRVPLTEQPEADSGDSFDLLALDEALEKLDEVDPMAKRIVEFRYFGGFNYQEIAEILDLPKASVWKKCGVAEAWLLRELGR